MKHTFRNATPEEAQTITIAFGGYYTHFEGGVWRVFRLLDFNVDSLHYQLFAETFTNKPILQQVQSLKPKIQHVPQQSGRILLEKQLELLGRTPLTEQDLLGYGMFYEEAHGFSAEELKERVERVIRASHEPPLRLLISNRHDGKVNVYDA